MAATTRLGLSALPARPYTFVAKAAPSVALPITDAFTGDNGSIDARLMTDGSHIWSVDAGTINIASNEVVGGAGGNNVASASNAPDTADVTVTAKFVTGHAANWGGVLGRVTDVNNFYLVTVEPGAGPAYPLELWRRVASNWLQIDVAKSYTITAGETFGLRCVNDQISLLKGGDIQETVTDANHDTGAMGIWLTGSGTFALDDFNVVVASAAFTPSGQYKWETIYSVRSEQVYSRRSSREYFRKAITS